MFKETQWLWVQLSYPPPITFLKQCLFDAGKTVRITCPGTYALAEDIVFNPIAENISAIEIDSDNVVLNLNCHSLKQGNDVPNIAGIYIIAHINVQISGKQGGIVSNFSQFGVRIEGGSSEIVVEDLVIRDNAFGSGQPFEGTQNPTHTAVTAPGFFVAGLAIGNTSRVGLGPGPTTKYGAVLNNLRLNNLDVVSNFHFGMGLFNVNNVFITNSKFNGNYSEVAPNKADDTTVSVAGVWVSVWSYDDFSAEHGVQNASVRGCQFNNTLHNAQSNPTSGAAVSCSGWQGFGGSSNNNVFEDCQFDNNTAVVTPANNAGEGRIGGFYVGRFRNTVFRGCTFNNNSGPFVSTGLHMSGFDPFPGAELIIAENSVVFENCTASKNGRPYTELAPPNDDGVGSASGIELFYMETVKITGLKASENQLIFTHPAGKTVFNNAGLYIEGINIITPPDSPGIEDGLIENCICADNITNGEFFFDSRGQNCGGIILNRWTNNFVVKNNVCGRNGNKTYGWGAGIYLHGRNNTPGFPRKNVHVLNNSLLENASDGLLVRGVDNVVVKDNVVTNNVRGIVLDVSTSDPGLPSANCTVLDNYLDNNTSKGIVNTEPTNTAFIARNISFKNGTLYTDAFVTTPAVPYETGTVSIFPSLSGKELWNVAILQS